MIVQSAKLICSFRTGLCFEGWTGFHQISSKCIRAPSSRASMPDQRSPFWILISQGHAKTRCGGKGRLDCEEECLQPLCWSLLVFMRRRLPQNVVAPLGVGSLHASRPRMSLRVMAPARVPLAGAFVGRGIHGDKAEVISENNSGGECHAGA